MNNQPMPICTGIKEVLYWATTRCQFDEYINRDRSTETDDSPGYMVEYLDGGEPNHPNHKGYISWSPKDVFERAYFRTSYEAIEFDEMSIPELAATLKGLKDNLEKVKALKTELQKSYDFLSIGVLPDRMDEEGIETLKITDVGRLQCSSDIRCSVPAANKHAVQVWLKDHGHASLVSETVNASTLKAMVKEMMKEGKDWPAELLKVEAYSRATVVKT